jgi:hypothetical protein
MRTANGRACDSVRRRGAAATQRIPGRRTAALALANAAVHRGGARSGGQAGQGRVRKYPDADRQRALVEVEGRLVQVLHRARTGPHAEPAHCAGHVLQVPGEVLAATGLLGAGCRVLADGRDRRVAQQPAAQRIVVHRCAGCRAAPRSAAPRSPPAPPRPRPRPARCRYAGRSVGTAARAAG